jgi:hypothetical protein
MPNVKNADYFSCPIDFIENSINGLALSEQETANRSAGLLGFASQGTTLRQLP